MSFAPRPSTPSALREARRFPNRIRELRRMRRLTVTRLAERVGCNRQHFTEVEAGRTMPSVILLHDIACGLGVPVDCLYETDWSRERRKQIFARCS